MVSNLFGRFLSKPLVCRIQYLYQAQLLVSAVHIVATESKEGYFWCGLVESYWDPKRKRSCKRTLLTLKGVTREQVPLLRAAFSPAGAAAPPSARMKAGVARRHGAVSATLRMVERLGLDRMLSPRRSPQRGLALALIVRRLLAPGSKLALSRELGAEGASTLGALLRVENASDDRVYAALDWLRKRQGEVERRLARRHLADGRLVLYDVSSSYFEGSKCPLAQFGYSRDRRRDRPQVVYGLLCSAEGCPVAVEAFAGNCADPSTLAAQIRKVRRTFGLRSIALVGDRGLLTGARIRDEIEPAHMDWISALGTHGLRRLVREGDRFPAPGPAYAFAEVDSSAYPGERLVVCYNPALAARRRAKRHNLLAQVEERLAALAEQYRRRTLSRDALNRAIGALKKYRMHKHLEFAVDDNSFSWTRRPDAIAAEAALDGYYAVRTSLPADAMSAANVVLAYKSLKHVERAFRCFKSDLQVRPVRHFREPRVRAHLFLCMLACHLEWHLRRALKPMLFDDPRLPPDDARDPVAPATRSKEAQLRIRARHDPDGIPLMTFPELLQLLDGIVAFPLFAADDNRKFAAAMSAMSPASLKAFRLLGCQPHPPPLLQLPAAKPATAKPS